MGSLAFLSIRYGLFSLYSTLAMSFIHIVRVVSNKISYQGKLIIFNSKSIQWRKREIFDCRYELFHCFLLITHTIETNLTWVELNDRNKRGFLFHKLDVTNGKHFRVITLIHLSGDRFSISIEEDLVSNNSLQAASLGLSLVDTVIGTCQT